MNFIINVGLNRKGGPDVSLNDILFSLMIDHKCSIISASVYDVAAGQSEPFKFDHEPTAVISFEKKSYGSLESVEYLLMELSEYLGQDCIAAKDENGSGRLIGPRAALWVSFDRSKFVLPSGRLDIEPKYAHEAIGYSVNNSVID